MQRTMKRENMSEKNSSGSWVAAAGGVTSEGHDWSATAGVNNPSGSNDNNYIDNRPPQYSSGGGGGGGGNCLSATVIIMTFLGFAIYQIGNIVYYLI
jgi:hypothetical protein